MEAESSSVGAQGGIRGGRRDSCCFSVDASPNPSFKAPGSRRSFTARKGSVAGADSSRRGSLVDASRRRGSMAGADGTRRGSLAGVDEGGRVKVTTKNGDGYVIRWCKGGTEPSCGS